MTENSAEDDSQVEAFAEDVDRFVKKRLKYKNRLAFVNFNTICISRKKADLYLRFKPSHYWPLNTIVIARIGFRTEQRKGHGSAFLSHLVQLSGKYEFEHIAIECANNGASIQGFLSKHGFKEYGENESGDWVLPLTRTALC